MSGTELVKACEEYLTLKRVFHYRNNTGATKIGDRFIRFGTKGAPDIIAVRNGHFIGIECKMGSGRLSKDQQAFADALRAAGGMYIEARSIGDLQTAGL